MPPPSQSFDGDTLSEGGFERGKVASSALLDQGVTTKDGKARPAPSPGSAFILRRR